MIKEFSELDCVCGHTFGKRPVSIVCFCNSYFLKFVCRVLICYLFMCRFCLSNLLVMLAALKLELLLLFVMPAL